MKGVSATDDAEYRAERRQRLTRWIDEYGDAILRTCYLCLNDAQQAEDAMQDTFLKAWNTMARFEARNGSSEKTWLARIAINTCRDYQRSRWFRFVDRSRPAEELTSIPAAVTDEERALFLAVKELPLKYKQMILLYYYHDMNLQEIAAATRTSAATVHRILKKARTMLRQSLTEEGY